MSRFASTQNKGFQMKFENGLTISVQFGIMNYCERRKFDLDYLSEMKTDIVNIINSKIDIVQSANAEIAIWDENDNWFNFGTDQVKGWCSPDEVADWIHKVKSATTIKDIENT